MILRQKSPSLQVAAPLLLRTGLQASSRVVPASRLFTERRSLLRQRAPSTQLNLFGPGGLR